LIKIKSSQVTKEVGAGHAYTSIQTAIDDAGYGEMILVHDGTYMENINFKGAKVQTRCWMGLLYKMDWKMREEGSSVRIPHQLLIIVEYFKTVRTQMGAESIAIMLCQRSLTVCF
jgi:hydrogenase maturation factor